MNLIEEIEQWKDKKVLIIGEALVDLYLYGRAETISPDAPVPCVKVDKRGAFLGGIGRVIKYVKSLGGLPVVCTIVGDDFEGNFFIKKMIELDISVSGIVVDKDIKTPQITKIKARNQHLLRLETDYTSDIQKSTIQKLFDVIKTASQKNDIDSIIILDYGIGELFTDQFIQRLLIILKEHYPNIPIIARPNLSNYYIYEEIDLIKINLQKALEVFLIDCCTDTSVSIAGKKIINSSKSKNVLLSFLESDSYLFNKNSERMEKFNPILEDKIRSYVAVGSVIMATLGLSYASKIPIS
ncbi:MAG: bifunctional heptose 7-phosphate kinase/heptose 1-phosphate adenyltransferase, partial [Promethearchaeota archaeon]